MAERKRLSKPENKSRPSKEELIARFKGKTRKGSPNRMSHAVKDALLKGVAKVGSDGKGKNGLVGYWERIAREQPELTAKLLAKIMPLEVRMTELAAQLFAHQNPVDKNGNGFDIRAIQNVPTDELKTILTTLQKYRKPANALTRIDVSQQEIIDAEFEEKDIN